MISTLHQKKLQQCSMKKILFAQQSWVKLRVQALTHNLVLLEKHTKKAILLSLSVFLHHQTTLTQCNEASKSASEQTYIHNGT